MGYFIKKMKIGEITFRSRRFLKIRTLYIYYANVSHLLKKGKLLTILYSGNACKSFALLQELKIRKNYLKILEDYMLREFVALVNEAVDDGFNRGLNLFMENLEEDLAKSEVIAEAGGVDTVIATILEADGYEVSVKDEDLENLDESKIDAMLDHFKKEGIN
jgi:hypothetical protein